MSVTAACHHIVQCVRQFREIEVEHPIVTTNEPKKDDNAFDVHSQTNPRVNPFLFHQSLHSGSHSVIEFALCCVISIRWICWVLFSFTNRADEEAA